MDRYELRRQDYSLSDDQREVQASFAAFFDRQCPTSTVRAAEPLGHDPALWKRLTQLGVTSMGLPESLGGDDASLVDLTLVTEEHGRALAPVPLIEVLTAGRLLARHAEAAPPGLLEAVADGTRLIGIALQPVPRGGGRQLVAAGAAVTGVLALRGEDLVLVEAAQPPPLVVNQGSAPLGWWEITPEAPVLATGEAARRSHELAVQEWKLLTAAALVGMTEKSLTLATAFATTRMTMGVPIGSLQGVAFPLADVAIAVAGARNLVHRAAWALANEPDRQPELVPAAFAYAARTATTGTTATAHAQGGLGFTVEADASLYFLRAKAWSLGAGDPRRDVQAIGDLLLARAGSTSTSNSTSVTA